MKSFQRDQLEHDQVVATLKETEQQLLDVEEVAGTNQQKGVTGDNDDEKDDDDCGAYQIIVADAADQRVVPYTKVYFAGAP